MLDSDVLRARIGSIAASLLVASICAAFIPRVASGQSFTKVTTGPPVTEAGAWRSVNWVQYDRDGDFDLFVTRGLSGGQNNVLFRNDGRGSFEEVTREAGLDVGNDRFSFSAAWGDYDGDGWPDLVVTNDLGRKSLYHNLGLRDGKVRFGDVAEKAGVEDHAAGMSVLFFDYDGDSRLDIYGGQMWSDRGLRVTASPHFMPDRAYRQVRKELEAYGRGLAERPEVVVAIKVDLVSPGERLKELQAAVDWDVVPISGVTGEALPRLVQAIVERL